MTSRAVSALVFAVLIAACGGSPSSPGASPIGSGAGQGWRLVADFPAQGAGEVSSIVAVGGGFVAVGYAFDLDASCAAEEYEGRIWTTDSGARWTALTQVFPGTRLVHLVEFGAALYAVGVTAAGDGGAGCDQGEDPGGTNLWRSDDDGSTWQRLEQPADFGEASVTALVVAGEALVAIGYEQGTNADRAATWTSSDGVAWSAAQTAPNTSSLVAGAARDALVVAFGDDESFPLAWISRDMGANWYEESIDVAAAPPDDLSVAVLGVVATTAGFVAVGDGCCFDPVDVAPLVLNSSDGTQWTGQVLVAELPASMHRVVAVPNGLLALGVETFLGDGEISESVGGRSWLSADGIQWRPGPRFDELGLGTVTAAASGVGGVVVSGNNEDGLFVWYTPHNALN